MEDEALSIDFALLFPHSEMDAPAPAEVLPTVLEQAAQLYRARRAGRPAVALGALGAGAWDWDACFWGADVPAGAAVGDAPRRQRVKPSLRSIARKFGLSKSTLGRYLTRGQARPIGRRTKIPTAEYAAMQRYILNNPQRTPA